MKVCPNCFNDYFVRRQLESLKEVHISDCSNCGSSNIKLYDASSLSMSETIFTYYNEAEVDGKTFVQCLIDDWEVFSQNVSYSNAEKIIKCFFSEFDFIGKYYVKNHVEDTDFSSWEEFKEDLIYENRFFPKGGKEFLERLEQIFPALLYMKEIPQFFRARISNEILPIDQMGKPPKDVASVGRANPVGISYLYVASNIKTAIAEVRPQQKDSVCIATFEPSEDFRLLDLRNPMKRLSPFELASLEIEASEIHRNLAYLVNLGNELSKPIKSAKAKLDYLPTQFLCEFIKHSPSRFDGVVYKSSVGDGFNLAIFDDEKVKMLEDVELHCVDEIKYSSSKIS